MVMRSQTAPPLAPDAPKWATDYAAAVDSAYVKQQPTRPIKLPGFVSGDLPNPADWPLCIIAVTDKTTVAYSTGAAWVRADGTAI